MNAAPSTLAGAPAASVPNAGTTPARRFGSDDLPFPTAGAALLAILLAVALWARWRASAAGLGGWATRPLCARRAAAGGTANDGIDDGPRVVAALSLDAHTRLHVVQWSGRRTLLALRAGQAPVVLDRRPVSVRDAGEGAMR